MVAFFIMGLEGIVLYLMLVRVYRSMGTTGYGSPKFIALCWGKNFNDLGEMLLQGNVLMT